MLQQSRGVVFPVSDHEFLQMRNQELLISLISKSRKHIAE